MTASRARGAAHSATNGRLMRGLARIGLTARGLVYLVIGYLAILVGLGGQANVDQRGALAAVLAQPYGATILWLLTIGFAAYALWRLSEAAFGATGEGRKTGPRLRSLARGAAYAVLAFTAWSLLRGATGTQAGQQGALRPLDCCDRWPHRGRRRAGASPRGMEDRVPPLLWSPPP
jgi:hypothetical protein